MVGTFKRCPWINITKRLELRIQFFLKSINKKYFCETSKELPVIQCAVLRTILFQSCSAKCNPNGCCSDFNEKLFHPFGIRIYFHGMQQQLGRLEERGVGVCPQELRTNFPVRSDYYSSCFIGLTPCLVRCSSSSVVFFFILFLIFNFVWWCHCDAIVLRSWRAQKSNEEEVLCLFFWVLFRSIALTCKTWKEKSVKFARTFFFVSFSFKLSTFNLPSILYSLNVVRNKATSLSKQNFSLCLLYDGDMWHCALRCCQLQIFIVFAILPDADL